MTFGPFSAKSALQICTGDSDQNITGKNLPFEKMAARESAACPSIHRVADELRRISI